MKKLYIYTGPVKSGKTSKLFEFTKSRNDVGGILSIVINSKKHLYNISTNESRVLEADESDKDDNIISTDKYRFKKNIFEWGRQVLKRASQKEYSYLIIDEIGPLEFKGSGLSPAVDEILNTPSLPSEAVIVVVRNLLVKKFCGHFKISKSEIEFITQNNPFQNLNNF